MTWEREQIGACTLYRGDALEVLPMLGKVDAVVTDPPYGLGLGVANDVRRNTGHGRHFGKRPYLSYDDTYEQFCQAIVPALNMALDRATCGAVFSGPHMHEQRKPTAMGGMYLRATSGRTPWGSKNFLPVLLYGNPPRAGQHRPTVRWECGRPMLETTEHPCAKPVTWMRWLIELASQEAASICDPFMGSGTTGVACVQLGRSFIGIEIEPRYFDLACQRIEEATRQGDLFVAPTPRRVQQEVLL